MTIPLYHTVKNLSEKKKTTFHIIKASCWFILGAVVGFFFFVSFLYIYYKQTYTNRVYVGVIIDGIDFGGKTEKEVTRYFAQKNKVIQKTTFIFTGEDITATRSARGFGFGYDEVLLARQALSIARSDDLFSNMYLMLLAYTSGVSLPPSYRYEERKLDKLLTSFKEKLDIQPIDAQFRFEDGRVLAFRPSRDGKVVDTNKLKNQIREHLYASTYSKTPQTIHLTIPIVTKEPEVTTEEVNKLGIKEMIGEGTSLFQHSITNRIYDITLAAARLNGILIKPGQTFSFTQTIGDISALTGYKQAYVIENGKTVLGDGGGVCQVSTTLFRAALNAGLPIIERHPHAYRVGYYEQDSAPGIDAATYYPTVDLQFTNDTDHHLLIQSYVDPVEQRLTFSLYGTHDNRETIITDPVVLSQTAAPEALYQDDPTLPKGEIRQVDFAASGARVFFTRTVKKDNEVIHSDKFVSNYRPWQAIFLRGTKE